MLLEALLDVLLLSRAETVVGPMMSNFARVALQLRVQPPTAKPRYVALDGRGRGAAERRASGRMSRIKGFEFSYGLLDVYTSLGTVVV